MDQLEEPVERLRTIKASADALGVYYWQIQRAVKRRPLHYVSGNGHPACREGARGRRPAQSAPA